MLTLKTDYDLLLEVPCWQQNGGKNWCAVISRDSKSPGGLGREFWKQQPGERGYYRIPEAMKPGTPLEFGADQVGKYGKRARLRRHFVIHSVSPTELILEEYDTAKLAIRQAERHAAGTGNPKNWDVHQCVAMKALGSDNSLVFHKNIGWSFYRGEYSSGVFNFCPGCGLDVRCEEGTEEPAQSLNG